jgi:hypothetical protein
MSKVIQITPPNPLFRRLLGKTITSLEDTKSRIIGEMCSLASCAGAKVIHHETDEELVAYEPDVRPVDQEALASLEKLIEQIGKTVDTLKRVADGKGQAPPEADPVPFLVDTDLLEVLGSKDGIRGWLEYSDLTGKGPRPAELLRIDSLTIESIENGRRVVAIGVGVDEEGHEGDVRVVTEENLQRDIEQYLTPMRGTWEWLEVEESE